jgi:hypothetical protein
MHLSLSRAFQRNEECDLKHPSSVDVISTNKTKQTNKLPSFIDRCVHASSKYISEFYLNFFLNWTFEDEFKRPV